MEADVSRAEAGLQAFFSPVKARRASQAIFDQIKEQIVSGKLKPGDRLPSERSMMEAFQRSRPTIREALRLLENSGLIHIMPGSLGAYVQECNTSGAEQSFELLLQTSRLSLRDLVEYRLHNDSVFARRAAEKRTEEDLAALRQILDRAAALIQEGDFEGCIRLDPEFHGRLARAGKNEVACIIARVLCAPAVGMMLRIVHLQDYAANKEMCARILRMHENIYKAVLREAVDDAEREMICHIQVFAKDMQKLEDGDGE